MPYKKSRDNWTTQVKVRQDDGSYKYVRKFNFLTRTDALFWENNYKKSYSKSEFSDCRKFIDLYESFIKHKEKTVRETTLHSIQSIHKVHISCYFEKLSLDKISNQTIIDFYNQLPTYSNAYLNKIHTTLMSIFNYGNDYDLCNIKLNVKSPKNINQVEKPLNFWSLDEYKTFSSSINSEFWLLVFDFLYTTGMT